MFLVHYPTRDLLRRLGLFKQEVFPDTDLKILFINPFVPSHWYPMQSCNDLFHTNSGWCYDMHTKSLILLNNDHCKANHGGYPVKTQLIRTVCYVKAIQIYSKLQLRFRKVHKWAVCVHKPFWIKVHKSMNFFITLHRSHSPLSIWLL